MVNRELVHTNSEDNLILKSRGWKRAMYIPKIGIISHHDPIEKQQILKKWSLTLGEYGNKFLNTKDLTCFNRGLDKKVYLKNGNKAGYED